MAKSKLKNKFGALIKAQLAVAVALFVAAAVNLFAVNTYADDRPATALTVSPMIQKIVLVPGETYEGTITVINGATAAGNLKYAVEVTPYSVKGDPNDEKNVDDYSGFDITSSTAYNVITGWVSLDKDSGEIEPNDKEVVTYKIRVPKDAPAGAQYMALLVRSVNEPSIGSGSGSDTTATIQSKTQLASTVFANVAGETVERGSITNNAMPSILTNSKLEATSMVRNEGNIYTDATYTLQVWPLFNDEELCTNEEKAETSTILPETERYHVQTCNLPVVGIFRAKQVVKIFGEESTLEKTIIVCPIWLMILILVIIIAIIIFIVITVKKHKKHSEEDDD